MAPQEKRQQPIPLTVEKRALLEQYKSQYEEKNGKTKDWGDFLGAIALLGLTVAGVYALAHSNRQTPQSTNVICSQCNQTFIMALPANAQNVIAVRCPYCQTDLVVPTENA